MCFHDQVVVLAGTGTATSIGLALADRFAAEGATLLIADVDSAPATARRFDAHHVRMDAGNPHSVAQAVNEIVARHSRIDVWVNLAGAPPAAPPAAPVAELAPADWDRQIAAMLSSAFYCAHHVGKLLIAQRRGAMVNVASVDGLLAQTGIASRSVAHAGLIMLTQVLASEWGPHGVRVNAVAPGIAAGEWTRYGHAQGADAERRLLSRIPMGRPAQTNEIVEAVVFLAGDEASFMTGSVLRVDGGWTGYHLFYPYETAFGAGGEE